jgi:HK97 gp10 family phage protein
MPQNTYAELQGADDLRAAFAALPDAASREVKEITRETTKEIEREAKARVRVRSGTTRDTLIKSKISGLYGSVSTWYIGRFLEHGTKKMPAKPFLFPAFESVRSKYLSRVSAAIYGAARSVSR